MEIPVIDPNGQKRRPGCPLGWFGLAMQQEIGRIKGVGQVEVNVQNIMPPCQGEACMFWRGHSQSQTGMHEDGFPRIEEEDFDCTLVRAALAVAKTGEL